MLLVSEMITYYDNESLGDALTSKERGLCDIYDFYYTFLSIGKVRVALSSNNGCHVKRYV